MDFTRRGLAPLAAALAIAPQAFAAAPPSRKTARAMVDVIVIGAGVSGLNTAWLLEQQGLSVTVLEGRQRVGGRVYTLLDQPGVPEMGFNAMGASYGRAIDAAKRSGVELYDAFPRMMKGGKLDLFLGGKPLTRAEWAALPSNPFPADRKAMMPWELSGRVVRENNPLQNWADWLEPQNAALDISLHDFLRAKGLSDAAIQLAVNTAPYFGTSAYDVSALMYEFTDGWTKAQSVAGTQSWAVKGGNMNLPIAMAKLLKGDVLLGREVIGIESDATGATVTCQDGARFQAKRVVCALPFATLRHIKIEPGLTGKQALAVETLPYQPITLAFLTVKSPFWQADGLSPSMWTDGFLGTVLAQHFGADEAEVTGLVASARGEMARYWDQLGRAEVSRRLIAEFEAVRPASKGQLTVAGYQSWAQERFNGGDWAYFGPGQISGFVRDMAASAGRVHFCGEHTATANRGMEAAFESSERVAIEVLSA
jgi:monoamine oxidase